MKEIFRTKINIYGNADAVEIDHDNKTYNTNIMPRQGQTTISRKDFRALLRDLKQDGYTEKNNYCHFYGNN